MAIKYFLKWLHIMSHASLCVSYVQKSKSNNTIGAQFFCAWMENSPVVLVHLIDHSQNVTSGKYSKYHNWHWIHNVKIDRKVWTLHTAVAQMNHVYRTKASVPQTVPSGSVSPSKADAMFRDTKTMSATDAKTLDILNMIDGVTFIGT